MSEQGNDEQGRDERPVLTNRQGHPVYDNQNNRTVGDRGPTVLENYQFLEKLSHFDRERIPERVVHARGAGAHGHFEAYGSIGGDPAGKYTRAKLFQEKGKRTPVFIRFSTVIHGGHSPENLRDPRGFAVKFYTEDGNWDLVGNNLQIFFMRDGQMAYHVDGVEAGENPHVNYEPSSKTDSLRESPRACNDHAPFVSGNVVRQKIGRQNN